MAKILASRIKVVIGDVIDEVQSAYAKGPLIINEICYWGKHRGKKILLFKADFNNAFDLVNWAFLDSMLEQMNFGTKWRSCGFRGV